MEASFEAYKREQSSIARRRLYPLTVFYTTYSLIVTLLVLNSRGPLLGITFYLAGVPTWTLVEYLFHRYVLHGRFPPCKGRLGLLLRKRLDTFQCEQHHERPFDGWHISGELKDFLPLFLVAAPLSFLLPVYTLPALLAGVMQSYVGEAWAHYFLHFRKTRNRFFRYLKRCHLYHHSQRAMENGYGITSGFLDCVFSTQCAEPVRRSLAKGGQAIRVRKMTRSEALRLFRERFKQQ